MNTTLIQKLSKQCCALQTFKDRCTWNSADFTVGGDCHLDSDASARINSGIRDVVKAEIIKLQTEIKDAVGFSDGN